MSLPFSSVLKFIDKQFETSRLLTEGEAVFEAKHVVVCSVKERGAKDVTLAALVLRVRSFGCKTTLLPACHKSTAVSDTVDERPR